MEKQGPSYKVISSPWRGSTFGWSLALDKQGGRMVVLEVCDLAAFQRVGARVFLKRLARTPDVLGQIIDQRSDERRAFIVSSVPKGQSLASLLESLTPEQRTVIASRLVVAISRAHTAGITVGVLRNESIYVDDQDVHVVSPGISSFCTAEGISGSDVAAILGSLAAPELVDGVPTQETDIYTLGRMLQQLAPDWDQNLLALLAGMTSDQPAWRRGAFSSLSRAMAGTTRRTAAARFGLAAALVSLITTGLLLSFWPSTPTSGNGEAPVATADSAPTSSVEPEQTGNQQPFTPDPRQETTQSTLEEKKEESEPRPIEVVELRPKPKVTETRPLVSSLDAGTPTPVQPPSSRNSTTIAPETDRTHAKNADNPPPSKTPASAPSINRPPDAATEHQAPPRLVAPAQAVDSPQDFELHLAPLPAIMPTATAAKPCPDLSAEEWLQAAELLKTASKTVRSYSSYGVEYLSSEETARRAVFQKLGDIRHQKVVQGLSRFIKDPSSNTRRFMVEALTRQDTPEAASILLSMVNDNDIYVAASARYGLSQSRNAEVVKFLTERALPSSALPAARSAAADALVAIGDPACAKPLRAALKDPDGGVRSAAAIGLGRMRTAEAADDLLSLLKDVDPRVRSSAILALAAINHQAAAPALVAALEDRAVNVRRSAATGLGALRSREAIPALIRNLSVDPLTHAQTSRALILTTGQCFDDDVKAWENWWTASKETFAPPPLHEGLVSLQTRKPSVTCYDIPVHSRQILYLFMLPGYRDEVVVNVRLEISRMLSTMGPTYFLNIIDCQRQPRPWQPHLVPCHPASAANALRFIDQIKFTRNDQDLLAGLQQAFQDASVSTIIVVSDSVFYRSSRTEDLQSIVLGDIRRLNQERQVTIHGISLSSSREFLEKLAQENGGQCVQVPFR